MQPVWEERLLEVEMNKIGKILTLAYVFANREWRTFVIAQVKMYAKQYLIERIEKW